MEPRFARALHRLAELFDGAADAVCVPVRFALIGGLGVSAWGAVRATRDIDLLADSDPSPLRDLELRARLRGYLEDRGSEAEWRAGDHEDPVPLLLRLGLSEITVDILWAHKQWQREALARSVLLKLDELEVAVLHPEDLILMKLDAGGPQDLLDVESLLSGPPTELNLKSLRQRAATLRLGKILGRCLRGAGISSRKS